MSHSERDQPFAKKHVSHQDAYEVDFSSAAATAEWSVQPWELWKGAGVAHGIQPLDQHEDHPGCTCRERS